MNNSMNNMNNMNNNFNQQPMGQMPNQQMNYGQPYMQGQSILDKIAKDKISLIAYIGALIIIVACFLPFAVIKAGSLSESMNYVSYNGEVKDGIFLIAAILVACGLIAFRKNKVALIPYVIGIIILIIDLADLNKYTGSSFFGLVEVHWGAGVYVIFVGLIAIAAHFVFYFRPDLAAKIFNKQTNMYNQPMNMNQQQPNQNNMFNQPMNMNQQQSNQNNMFGQQNKNNNMFQ